MNNSKHDFTRTLGAALALVTSIGACGGAASDESADAGLGPRSTVVVARSLLGDAGGDVFINGQLCDVYPCERSVEGEVELLALPKRGTRFAGFAESGCGQESTCQLEGGRDYEVSADFVERGILLDMRPFDASSSYTSTAVGEDRTLYVHDTHDGAARLRALSPSGEELWSKRNELGEGSLGFTVQAATTGGVIALVLGEQEPLSSLIHRDARGDVSWRVEGLQLAYLLKQDRHGHVFAAIEYGDTMAIEAGGKTHTFEGGDGRACVAAIFDPVTGALTAVHDEGQGDCPFNAAVAAEDSGVWFISSTGGRTSELVHIDSKGAVERRIQVPFRADGIAVHDGRMFVAGDYRESDNIPGLGGHGSTGGKSDVVVAEITALGAIRWARALQSPGFDDLGALAVAEDGASVVVVGNSKALDGVTGPLALEGDELLRWDSADSGAAWATALDLDGEPLWSKAFTSTGGLVSRNQFSLVGGELHLSLERRSDVGVPDVLETELGSFDTNSVQLIYSP